MKFLKLEILNLASLDRQGGEVINFEEGALGDSTIFSIVGSTGSGKSTLLDAICLSLYNRAPRYPKKKGDRGQSIEIFGELEEGEKNRLAPTDPRNILTRGKKEGYSKLTFRANNGSVYRAEWYVRHKTKNYDDATTTLYKLTSKDGQLTEEEANWSDLPAIIGLDYEQFLRTVLIAQGTFANFLTAKENDRYELLEKLIGCEELYTTIAAKIKEQKDNAVAAYNQIAANFTAQEKDIIPEEDLATLREKITQLKAAESEAKEELAQVIDALAWYTAEETFLANIGKYEEAFNTAKQKLEAIKADTDKLALHDATLPAVGLYKEIEGCKKNIATHDSTLKTLTDNITNIKNNINVENGALENLRKVAEQAGKEFENQKPHINKAREIKAQLGAAKSDAEGKQTARDNADIAWNKAIKDVEDNARDIETAKKKHEDADRELTSLLEEIQTKSQVFQQKVNTANAAFTTENQKLSGMDAAKLQTEKDDAAKAQTDLKEAIRIQQGLAEKNQSHSDNERERQRLTDRNTAIDEELKGFAIEQLTAELQTLRDSYTLMTSEDWQQHRHNLVDGQPCPLCGAIHHPYHTQEQVQPVIHKMHGLIAEKSAYLDGQTTKKQGLLTEQGANQGKLSGIATALGTLEKDIEGLNNEWKAIQATHAEWPADVEQLKALQPNVDSVAIQTANALSAFNTLAKNVGTLREEKETAESEQRKYDNTAAEQKHQAEQKRTDANTLLETEKGKTANLLNQQEEKKTALDKAKDEYNKAAAKVTELTAALKAEIGDNDPDAFEQALNTAKADADKAVEGKEDAIGKMREEQKNLEGQETTVRQSQSDEENRKTAKSNALTDWLTTYNSNEQHEQKLTLDDIALLYSATDNWEAIRSLQKKLGEAYTSAETTFKNEKDAHTQHQEKKPEADKDSLTQRKQKLDGRSNTELIDSNARLQRHNAAQQQMGAMFDQKQAAENLKKEWEQIADAIGGDGKTLRKIAQCYTLRFLVEHANVEIRKFNTRYELQHVKNSLGIRVIDHDRADDVRDITSLSGGETFIVSLGLALGLSSLSSRNISFENLFIDEGFGTLDPETLATVIDSLAMLQSSQGKKVGVISHTDTMSERITTQIRIIKNGSSGSSHIEIYP